MGTNPQIEEIDPAIYAAVVSHQTRRAAHARWANTTSQERYEATKPARAGQAAKRAAREAEAAQDTHASSGIEAGAQ